MITVNFHSHDVDCVVSLRTRHKSVKMPHHQGYFRTPSDPYMRLPRGTSRARATATRFCASIDSSPHLAVIGILSPDEHIGLREQLRATWLASEPRVLARFVLRGVNALAASLNESHMFGDIVFVKAPAQMPRKTGPLLKLFLWLQCATVAWPQAQLIGKADDDTYVHLPGIADHLEHTMRFANGAPIYWGSFESFHWQLDRHRPIGFAGRLTTRGGRHALEHCKRRAVPAEALDTANAKKSELSYGRVRSYSVMLQGNAGDASSQQGAGAVGPFHFARGPLVLVSRALVDRLCAPASWALGQLPSAVASGNVTSQELTWPWEDVFLGLALAHLDSDAADGGDGGEDGEGGGAGGHAKATPSKDVLTSVRRPIYMNIPEETFTARWGFCMADSTLIWHMKTKNPHALERIGKAHAWKQQHHCAPTFNPTCGEKAWVGCRATATSRAVRWRACTTTFPKADKGKSGSCTSEVQDLLQLYYGRPTGTRCAF